MLVGNYDATLVLTSLFVAILASYTALGMAGRVAASRGVAARVWLGGGAFAMGLGIWSMHFIGMLAFSLPIPLGYDVALTVASMALAVACSAFALWVVTRATLPWRRLAGAAALMGTGIAAMHYTGMAAMRMHPAIEYSPALFMLSVAVAIVASGAALWITHALRHNRPGAPAYRICAAIVMGLAIVGMHYTGMAAANFPQGSVCMAANSGISAGWLAVSTAAVTLAVLAVALVVAVLDTRLETRTSALNASLAQANEELVQMALHDTLTKLPNRALLDERLKQAIIRATAAGRGFSLLFIDLDGFKAINDAYGHGAGDLLLVEMAQRIKRAMRPQDCVARLGGDEFVVLADLPDPNDAAGLAERLIDTLTVPAEVQGHEVSVAASIGIALFPGDGADASTLLAHADAAMYHAKRLSQTHRVSFFEPSMNEDALEQLQLLQDLRLALPRNQLELHYQPKFVAPAGPVVGAEALLRWNHPTRGVIGPTVFIPIAERTGLIFSIGAWVLDEACRQMRQWRDMGHADWTVAVNLSSLQFSQPDLIDSIRATLARHGLPPRCLAIEITESTAMRDAEASLTVLRELAELGVSISIDDFGTGYSSLLYLKRLPATELKIDRGFVNQLEHDNEDAAIVSAIIALGQKLNLKIVAEGVETLAQQSFLTEMGCDSLQGFLLGRPLPAAEFLAHTLQPQPA
ncbi:diguanylate cyclase (GGDEF) domain protein [Bordetella bronchiseptica MBORD678]|uniref:putative bifunctional diguanylate cyclase/phosphodiesterase n=1 Tax=Bordetella bronchiseptica TaxID=518 RepID=UPI0004613731|nr:EAL domain-containing protein [Bordetella bronchiseptica]KDC60885.1 diguanylate cyclase (GGDEF) domain protein [Bordetella bronchiseptica MBORD595]KDC77890.1 diguanylate cyclase (GGDEF) domain protein [Bordetella bronchiseptica MBORD635]KDC82937.1 diguanylate cyclase (GGDEF) domain protein [Bordetella bronchiseptica MBORD665]KDC83869.1 diguanylate cyclase (GGDEF) domain protein [Bordetella bronchiseptica MBORD668]KDD16104.1 diguanylate cyclase (GGDEF) domain protein [Bordetella bronchisepti